MYLDIEPIVTFIVFIFFTGLFLVIPVELGQYLSPKDKDFNPAWLLILIPLYMASFLFAGFFTEQVVAFLK